MVDMTKEEIDLMIETLKNQTKLFEKIVEKVEDDPSIVCEKTEEFMKNSNDAIKELEFIKSQIG